MLFAASGGGWESPLTADYHYYSPLMQSPVAVLLGVAWLFTIPRMASLTLLCNGAGLLLSVGKRPDSPLGLV